MSDNKKSYFAVIPAKVRYDKTLPMGARMLYGEFTALSNEKGYCYASNNYFASLYEVTPQAISKWINLLADKKYISVDYIRDGKLVKERHIYIEVELHTGVSTPIDTVSTSISEVSTSVDMGINKGLTGYQQKIKENNTDLIIQNNNTKNNSGNKNKKETFPKEYYQRVIETYSNNYLKLNDDIPAIDYKSISRLLKQRFETFGFEAVNKAVTNSINHKWLVESAKYSFQAMLSSKIMTDLINGTYERVGSNSNKQNKSGEYRRFDGSISPNFLKDYLGVTQ